MATVVQICNSALLSIGAATINSLTEDSTEANLCLAKFELVRRAQLRTHPWNFAIKRVELAATIAAPIFRYKYKYALPSDNLRLLKAYNVLDYKVERAFLLADHPNVFIKYIFDETDTTNWTSTFTDAVITKMASELAYSLTGTRSMAEYQEALYQERIAQARRIDASEDIEDRLGQGDDTLVAVRY